MKFVSKKMSDIKPSGIRELFAKAQGIKGVISLGIGAPDIQTPEELKKELIKAVNNNFNNYDQTPGNAKLRDEIAKKYLNEYGVEYNPQNGIIVTAGGVELIYLALQDYLKKGDEVLIQDPCFLTYPRQVALAGGKPVWMPSTHDFKIDVEKMKELINDKTRMIMLNFPSNPTGAMMEKEELKAIVDVAVDNNLIILSDEVYEYYVFDGRKHIHIASLGDAYHNTITINSFSKSYCVPGWRMGYGVSSPELLNPILGYHSFVVANATTPTQIALSNYMGTEKAKEFRSMIRVEFQERRDTIVKGLNSLPGIKAHNSSGSFYTYFDVSGTGMDSEEFSKFAFEKAKVVLVPGTEFGQEETQKTHLRASFGSANNEKLREVIERFAKIL
ncbi:MAG: pyridoxal phosphate-dependent aminotransferase [Candidatus Heimdallarchaeaceae archaeon]